MKVSRVKASDNRDAIIVAAANLLREHGFARISVAEVARNAGLTHGALYSHFESKDALQAQALQHAFSSCMSTFSPLSLDAYLSYYMSAEHRDTPGGGCPTSALVTEVRSQSLSSKSAFRDGLEMFMSLVQNGLQASGNPSSRDRTLFTLAAMVGGVAIARAIKDVDADKSDEVLASVERQLRTMIAQDEPPSAGTSDAAVG